ncbi:protein D3 isoform X1 [Bemisia tabaci]|uniref:protein D3 isoform X1 n=1 Tax=Bemisia tabaci TaxID=7038 RepID=UPI003B289B48
MVLKITFFVNIYYILYFILSSLSFSEPMTVKIPIRTPAEIRDALMRHGIVPELIEKAPKDAVEVTYGKNIVDFGNNLTDSDIRNEPTHVSWPAEKDSLYTLMLIGPDIPTHENPEDKECQHWIVANIPGDDLKIGHYLSEYVGILSFYERGTHRLLFLVFKQSSKNTPLKFEKKEYVAKKIVGYMRAFFVFKPFAAKYHLGEPVAANFFLVQTKPHQRNFSNIPAGLIARHKTAP